MCKEFSVNVLFPSPCTNITATAIGKLTLNPNVREVAPTIAKFVSRTGFLPTESEIAPQHRLYERY